MSSLSVSFIENLGVDFSDCRKEQVKTYKVDGGEVQVKNYSVQERIQVVLLKGSQLGLFLLSKGTVTVQKVKMHANFSQSFLDSGLRSKIEEFVKHSNLTRSATVTYPKGYNGYIDASGSIFF